MRLLTVVITASLLCAASATAQKRKPSSAAAAAKAAANATKAEEWVRVGLPKYNYSFAHPREWVANQMEHPDPDIAVDMNAEQEENDFNAIELNREGVLEGMPYIMVYAIKKPFQTWDEYGLKLVSDMIGVFSDTKIHGADTTFTFKGFPGYDVTYEVPSQNAFVRSIVIYANGLRYGVMYSTVDDPKSKVFKEQMPRFERLLETFEVHTAEKSQ